MGYINRQMKYAIILSFIPFVALAAAAQAEDHVSVIWRRNEIHPNGREEKVLPPTSYVKTLEACGVRISGKMRDLFPVAKLHCKGVLDFSQSEKYKNLVRPLLESLLKNKIKKIGDAEISLLLAKLDKLQMAVSPWGVFEAAVDLNSPESPRHAAINIDSEKLVVLNSSLWKYVSPEFRDLLLLHEVFGAAGFSDEHYELTLTAWWLARHPERIKDYLPKQGAGEKELGPSIKIAGVSVVGHGGDFSQIQFKASLLEAILRNIKLLDANGNPVPRRFLPTKKEEEQAIITAMIFSMPTQKMMEGNLCTVPGNNEQQHAKYCGDFLLKGKTGVPFLVINREWGTFPEYDQRWPLLFKLYISIQSALACDKGFPCGGN